MLACTKMKWLVGRPLQSFIRREDDWLLTFEGEASLTIQCLWRLLESNRICHTSQDEGQWFGLPAPVDASAEAASRLSGIVVEAVLLRDGTLDLDIHFATGHVLQVIPDSGGYEAWKLIEGNTQFIAVGGGDLAVFSNS